MTRRSLMPALMLLAAFAFVSLISPAHADASDGPLVAGAHATKVENLLGSLHLNTSNIPMPSPIALSVGP